MVFDQSLETEFDIVRNYNDFLAYIKKNGLPNFISFDNDLGLDENGFMAPDGYGAAKWLGYESNPVATEQIKDLLNNYINYLKESR